MCCIKLNLHLLPELFLLAFVESFHPFKTFSVESKTMNGKVHCSFSVLKAKIEILSTQCGYHTQLINKMQINTFNISL